MSFHQTTPPKEIRSDKSHKKPTGDQPVSEPLSEGEQRANVYGPDGRNCFGETREQTMARRERDRINTEKAERALMEV